MQINKLTNARKYLLLLALATVPQWALASGEGRVFYIQGGAYIDRGGQHLPIRKDDPVDSGDTIVTEDDGHVQWQMLDDTYFAMRPSSRFTIADYQTPGAAGAGKASYKLAVGGVHALTGSIAKDALQFSTPNGDVQDRGTDFTLVVCQGDCSWAAHSGQPAPANGLYSRVDVGGITVTNSGGKLDVNAGQLAFTAGPSSLPAVVTAVSVFTSWVADFAFHFPGNDNVIDKLNQRIEPCVAFDPSPSKPQTERICGH